MFQCGYGGICVCSIVFEVGECRSFLRVLLLLRLVFWYSAFPCRIENVLRGGVATPHDFFFCDGVATPSRFCPFINKHSVLVICEHKKWGCNPSRFLLLRWGCNPIAKTGVAPPPPDNHHLCAGRASGLLSLPLPSLLPSRFRSASSLLLPLPPPPPPDTSASAILLFPPPA